MQVPYKMPRKLYPNEEINFMQVIKARFGRNTHLVFCCFAFFTNIIVMMSLLMGGTAVLNSLVQNLSPEMATMVLATVIGGYTLIGGLGATFYVSYFNTSLIFILILIFLVEVKCIFTWFDGINFVVLF